MLTVARMLATARVICTTCRKLMLVQHVSWPWRWWWLDGVGGRPAALSHHLFTCLLHICSCWTFQLASKQNKDASQSCLVTLITKEQWGRRKQLAQSESQSPSNSLLWQDALLLVFPFFPINVLWETEEIVKFTEYIIQIVGHTLSCVLQLQATSIQLSSPPSDTLNWPSHVSTKSSLWGWFISFICIVYYDYV